jgi:hypothetical protein
LRILAVKNSTKRQAALPPGRGDHRRHGETGIGGRQTSKRPARGSCGGIPVTQHNVLCVTSFLTDGENITVSLCELSGVELCTLFGVLFEYGSTGGVHQYASTVAESRSAERTDCNTHIWRTGALNGASDAGFEEHIGSITECANK